jgi:hypothetical protein
MFPLLNSLKAIALRSTSAFVCAPGDAADAIGRPNIDIDENGSLVTLPEAEWLICFVPGLYPQWWHRFANKRHKHVFAIRKLDDNSWLLVEPWWTRLMVNVLTFDQASKFLHWGAAGHVLKVREAIPGRGTQLRGWSNCAVLMAFLLGRSYWTWTPQGLYRRLLADTGVESLDPSQFLSEQFRAIGRKITGPAPRLSIASQQASPGKTQSLKKSA